MAPSVQPGGRPSVVLFGKQRDGAVLAPSRGRCIGRYDGPAPAVVILQLVRASTDMDGLLLDTEGAYTVAQQRILDRFGRKFTVGRRLWEVTEQKAGRGSICKRGVGVDTQGWTRHGDTRGSPGRHGRGQRWPGHLPSAPGPQTWGMK